MRASGSPGHPQDNRQGTDELALEGCNVRAFSPAASLDYVYWILSPKAQGLPAYQL